jgi:hypothetical protein
MQNKTTALITAAAMFMGVSLCVQPAQAQNPGDVIGAVVTGAAVAATGGYLWGGRQYCWYDDGWRGPGWYWCGYGANYGYGWGGGYGWHHWHGGHGGGGGHHHHH